ncbi:hypothetical protein J4206_04350, partial [Candidatus Woesearchaeota archaeon]|nr:hypothetical protein [Candidatus Woesearchaeota archaeon]
VHGRNVDAYELMQADFFKAEQGMPQPDRQNVVRGAYKEILTYWYPSADSSESGLRYIPELQSALGPEACKKVALEALEAKADKLVAKAAGPHHSCFLHPDEATKLNAYMKKFGIDAEEANPILLALYHRLEPHLDKTDRILEQLATTFKLGEHDPAVKVYMDAKIKVAEAVGAKV